MTLLIFDGNNLGKRMFHAGSGRVSMKGKPCGATTGFLWKMCLLIEEYNPRSVIVCWDSSVSVRSQKHPDYKANRVKESSDSWAQDVKWLRSILERIGVAQITVEGWEADDVICSIKHQAPSDAPKIIVSGDKDMLALVGPDTFVHYLHDDCLLASGDVLDRLGITSSQVHDFKAIAGDSSDNIKGIPGIGEVGAKKILQIGTLAEVYEQIDAIKADPKSFGLTKAIASKLDAGIEEARKSWSLVRLNHQLDIPSDIDRKTEITLPDSLEKELTDHGLVSNVQAIEGVLQAHAKV